MLFLLMTVSGVAAARCQVTNVSYDYPHIADTNQQIKVSTTVSGSCATSGEDYYTLRLDLVEMTSNSTTKTITNSTPIGYTPNDFTVTVEDTATTPSVNGTWPIQVHVYVIRAGGTSGAFLLDYQNVTNVTIQVGTTPVPEFNIGLSLTLVASLIAAMPIISRSNRRRRT
jgi:hypothetical protein